MTVPALPQLPREFRFFERTTVVVLAMFNVAFIGLCLYLVLGGKVPVFGSLVTSVVGVLVALALWRMDRLRVIVDAQGLRVEGGGIHYHVALSDVRVDDIGYFETDWLWRAGRPWARGYYILGFAYYEYDEPRSRKTVLIRSTGRLLKIPTREFDLLLGLDDTDAVMTALRAAAANS